MGGTCGTHRCDKKFITNFVPKRLETRPLRKARHRGKDNIKMALGEIGRENVH
jgi:hypothetical protein